jgi:hypothetical protein
LTFLPEDRAERAHAIDAVFHGLRRLAATRQRRALLLRQVDGEEPGDSVLAEALGGVQARRTSRGWQILAKVRA